MKKEMDAIAPNSMKTRIIAAPERKYSVCYPLTYKYPFF
jgi:hypothetical protein